jgi:hypothetical protein
VGGGEIALKGALLEGTIEVRPGWGGGGEREREKRERSERQET